MKSRITRKVFPFAPGIAWKIQNGKYIVPEIDAGTWSSVLDDKKLVVLAYGGLLESFYSFSVVEALRQLESSKQLFWAGNAVFQNLLKNYGGAKFKPEVPFDLVDRYPTPLFLDKKQNAYFNVLNNYRIKRSYYRSNAKADKSPVVQQIFRNSMLPWDARFVPEMKESNFVDRWSKTSHFHKNKKYVLMVPEATGLSIHGFNCLPWGHNQIREFIAMLHKFDVQVVICTGENGQVYDAPYIAAPRTIEAISGLLPDASLVLSSDIDILFLALAISNASIIAPIECSQDEFDLYNNAEFIGAENMISTTNDLTPAEVYTLCEGIL